MLKIEKNFSLKNYNSFGVDVSTEYFVEIKEKEDIKDFLKEETLRKKENLVLGCGTNILFTDDFKGVILKNEMKGIEIIDEDDRYVHLKIASGEKWDDFVKFCVEKGYYGIENLSYVPGSVGAASVQNIGAYGVEVKNFILEVEGIFLDEGKEGTIRNKECKFDYRDSIFKRELKNKFFITSVLFRLSKKKTFNLDYKDLFIEMQKFSEINLENIREAIRRIRNNKLPDIAVLGNAGSFFKNPVINRETFETLKRHYLKIPYWELSDNEIKISAAWLIEQCGWKGKRIGNVGTYKNQPLVIVNYGNATGKEIKEFAEKLRKIVKSNFAINLEPEVDII